MLEKSFAKNLKKARDAAGLSQKELSEVSDCRQSDISDYENEKKLPNLLNAINLANALGVSLDALCSEDAKSKTITSFQWLCFLDDLLDNPPTIQSKAIITLRQSELGTADLVFSSLRMQEFFNAYAALRIAKDAIGKEPYLAARNALFDTITATITPGYHEITIGAKTANPPVTTGGETNGKH